MYLHDVLGDSAKILTPSKLPDADPHFGTDEDMLAWCEEQEMVPRKDENGEWDGQTLRRLLRTHSVVTTRLPLEDGRVIEIRKPSLPDAEQALVYARLGIDWKQACPARKFVMK